MSTFAQRLTLAIEARLGRAYLNGEKFSQNDIEKAAGLYPGQLTPWKNGEKCPVVDNVQLLPEVLGCSAAWLVFGHGEPFTGISSSAPADDAAPSRPPLSESGVEALNAAREAPHHGRRGRSAGR